MRKLGILIGLVLFVRIFPRLMSAEIWAEDGTAMVAGFFSRGWASVFVFEFGYFNPLQRAIVGVVSFLPLAWLPYAIQVAFVLTVSCIFSQLLSEDLAWLSPNRMLRFFCGVALCFAPGFFEVMGNLANLYWFLFYSVVFILLRTPGKPLGVFEGIWAAACIFSIGLSILLIPLSVWRAWDSYRRRSPRWYADAILTAIVFLNVAILILYKEPGGDSILTVFGHAKAWWAINSVLYFFQEVFVRPILGVAGMQALAALSSVFFSTLCWVAMSGLAYLGFRNKKIWKGKLPWVALSVSLLFWPVLHHIFRGGLAEIRHLPVRPEYYLQRESLSTPFFGLLLWFLVFLPSMRSRLQVPLAVWILLLGVVNESSHLQLPPYGEERYWLQNLEEIQKVARGERPSIAVPIYPKGRAMLLEAPTPSRQRNSWLFGGKSGI